MNRVIPGSQKQAGSIHQMLPLRRLPPLPLPRGPAARRLLSVAASAASPLPWPGLHAWRGAPPSDLRTWGPNGPCASDADEAAGGPPEADAGGSSLAEMGALVLSTADPLAKARLTHAAFSRWAAGLPVGQAAAPEHPARPDKPLVVSALLPPWFWHFVEQEVVGQSVVFLLPCAGDAEGDRHPQGDGGAAQRVHAAQPGARRAQRHRPRLGHRHVVPAAQGHARDGFFADFARVAGDESRHIRLYSQRLAELGFRLVAQKIGPYFSDSIV